MEFVSVKTMMGRTKDSRWFGIDYNMNIYRGCNHGCIYCDSRSDCYHVEDFDRVRAKADCLNILEQELSKKRGTGVIGTGAMSDPYNAFEGEYKLTRGALELIQKYEFGVAIATKSPLICRDIDVLSQIQKHSPVLAKITITAATDELSQKIETNVAPSSKRFEAIRRLREGGIHTGILLMPVLPFLEDQPDQILSIVEQGALAGAQFIYPGFGVTLRQNQRDHYYKALDKTFPGLRKQYEATFGDAYSCQARNAKELYGLFAKACQEKGIAYKMKDIIELYWGPYEKRQLKFF